ncbi:MAG: outer membrane protein assembly factor BamB [Gammaproteobacteria bacterium]
MIARGIVLGLLLLLSGCSWVTDYLAGDTNRTPPTPLADFKATIKPVRVWSADVGGVSKDDPVRLTPALCDGKLFAAGGKGRLYAFDAVSGKTLWQVNSKAPISGGVGCGDDLVLVGTEKGRVMAYHAADGKSAWQATVSSEVLAPPRAGAGLVVARTIDGKVFGLDVADGSRHWVYDRSTPALSLRGSGSVAFAHGAVVAGFDTGKLVAVTLADGKPIWEASIAVPSGRSELERMVDIDSDPRIVDDHVYIATYQGRVASVAMDSGHIEWVRDMSSYSGVAVDSDHLYLSDDQSQVWGLERSGGGVLWKQDKLIGRDITAPTAFGDYVVVGDFDGYVHWLSKDDGAFVARDRVDSKGFSAAPVAGDDLLYVQGRGGVVAAYKIGSSK